MSYFPLVVVASAFLWNVVTSVMGQCPLQCSCSVVHTADCTNSSLSEIPESGFNQHLTELIASFNSITILSQDSLRKIQDLTHLNLSYNNITSINSKAFMTLKHLKSLDLTRNYINSIDSGTFMYNQKLEWLSLADNPTFTLPNKGFHIPSLLFWNLSYCNIQNIHLDTFKETGKLRQLYLNNNKIVSLNERVLRYLNQLQTLDLCYNALQNIDARVFSRLSELTSLSLCHNNVSRITITLLDELIRIGEVDLEGNPWICDCDTANVYASCAEKENCSLNLICEFPDDLKRKQWSVTNALACKTTTSSTIVKTSLGKKYITTTDQTEETIRRTLSSESPQKEVPLEMDAWFWVMIGLSILCSLTFISVILLFLIARQCKYRYSRENQMLNEYSRHPQNENYPQLQTSEN